MLTNNFPKSIGLSKTIGKLAQKKDCRDISAWQSSITNYMYWCAASTPDGNGDVMTEKWKILLYHILDIHTNEESNIYQECGHGELDQ